MKTKDGLLQTEDVPLQTEHGLLTTADNGKWAQVNWTQCSTTLGH